jgi:hypothetical protein
MLWVVRSTRRFYLAPRIMWLGKETSYLPYVAAALELRTCLEAGLSLRSANCVRVVAGSSIVCAVARCAGLAECAPPPGPHSTDE